MRISFDLDDTLICYNPQVPREPNRVPLWWRWKEQEPLRLGTVDLAQQLQEAGHELMVYTTSLRNPAQVKRWLGFYGFRAAAVINAELHAKAISHKERHYSKMPWRFDVALHVDDENFVEVGQKFGMSWLLIATHDLEWTAKILKAVQDIEMQKR
ncbi:MAG: hypothetical protein KY445_00485 [Armatimonadetes bacterium]|nr:hypothetical protein [Armatimonadota bacterium]